MKFLYAITSDSRPSEVKVGYYYGEIIDMLKECTRTYDNVNLLHYIETDDYSFTLMLINKFLNVTCDKDCWYKCDSKIMKNILLRVSTEIDRLNNSIKNIEPKDRIFKSCNKREDWEYIEQNFMKTIDWEKNGYIIDKKEFVDQFMNYCNSKNFRIKDIEDKRDFILFNRDPVRFGEYPKLHKSAIFHYNPQQKLGCEYIEKYKLFIDELNFYYSLNELSDLQCFKFNEKLLKEFIIDESISIINSKEFISRYAKYLIKKKVCPILAYELDSNIRTYDKILEKTMTFSIGNYECYYQSLIEL